MMITKVLVAEDHELANISLQKALGELGVIDIDYAYYCDDALIKIRNALLSGAPYDLLITDLHFEDDGNKQRVRDGVALIKAGHEYLPAMKVLVFSVESKPVVIDSLYQLQNVDAYVRKSRNDGKELKLALEALGRNQRYFPRHLSEMVKHKNAYQFTDLDLAIINLLANGVSQKNIPSHLQEKGMHPSSLSSVEKRLNHIKSELDCSKNEQLVAFCKDMGII
jgi:DNA-binding NarL/FixJ family response regulator